MNILVCPNTTIIGGASLDAVDLAAAMRERGHQLFVLGPPGALVERLGPLGITWIEGPATDDGTAPELGRGRALWPSVAVMRRIRRVVADEHIDVVHTYEWPRCLEADYGAHLVDGIPLVSTILAVKAPKFLPRTAHIVVGARELADLLKERSYPAVTLIEPWIRQPPTTGTADGAAQFASAHRLDEGVPVVVIASRLSGMKMDSLRLAIEATKVVASDRPVQLVIAGEGAGEQELRDRAEQVNRQLGRRAITFTGLLDDVGPAYASADVVLGMGTALLGGMAYGKPAIVVGEGGFSELLTNETEAALSAVGFWGEGPAGGAADRLAGHLIEALRDPERTGELAACSMSLVARRLSRAAAGEVIEGVYRETIASTPPAPARLLHAGRSFARFAAMRGRGKVARLRQRTS